MIVWVILGLIVLLFCFVVFFGAPYVPTLKPQAEEALDALDLKAGQTMLELGSGDGRILRRSAERGVKVIGYELNPFLVIISYFVTIRYRDNVKIVWGNFWRRDLPKADGVFVFLLPKYMDKLDQKFENYSHKPIKLASFAFDIKGKRPTKRTRSVFLYTYK